MVAAQSLPSPLPFTPTTHHHQPSTRRPHLPLLPARRRPLLTLSASPTPASVLSANGLPPADTTSAAASAIDVDAVTEAELKENGFRSTRRTKLVCTVGPATCGFDQLEALAVGGMNVARINMCHGTREWHRGVIERVRRLNEEKGYAVAIMMDTEGSEIHMCDLGGAASTKAEVLLLWF